ncbi:ras-GEF domain-containing family member 1B-like isoform X2 [Anopheles stephensi]|uniref:ras-GEF domain-containing family member 1B-like isoform X2 n=1 Tax=Anopheles stephensi TaxID=30069 RepID=UPI001658727A|nr:ras-GEF domain-containing family member 1B-like isoform X2 [Anopheles stephensi]
MNSTTVPTATNSSVHPKKPPVPVKPRSIPPPPNPLLASAASSLNTPKGGSSIRTSLLAQRLEETLRLGLGELEVVQPTRHTKPSGQSEDTTGKHVLSGSGGGGVSDADAKQKKQSAEEHNLQAALQAEMRRQCGSIKARFLLERRLPQNGSVAKELTGHDPLYTKADDLLLHYTEGNLISGSLDGLLTHFTPTGTYIPDRSFIFTFLLAARQFLRPDEILEKTLRSAAANGGTANLPHLLAAWMHDFPYDFRDERMMRLVRSFTEQQSATLPHEPPERSAKPTPNRGTVRERTTLSRALRRLAHQLARLEKYELEKSNLQQLKYGPDEWKTAPSLVELASGSPVLMANTLTAIEAERFSFIGPEEFFPSSCGGSGTGSGYRTGTGSNLLAYVQWYNRLTYVVATDILRSPRKRHRARAVEFWIETGRECFNRGNFNSLMAIIATLTGGPIGRLKKTWTKVTSSSSSLLSGMTSSSMISSASGIGNSSSTCSSAAGGGRQQLAILEHQADPTNNFATYRATLQAAAWRSCPTARSRSSSTSSSKSSQQNSSCSSDDGQGPTNAKKGSAVAVLPFFSLLLKDLHFLNETSGSSILPNGHINFDKWRQLGERLSEVRRWQRQSSYQRRCRLGRRHKSVTSAEVTALRDAIERGAIIGDRETSERHDTSKGGTAHRDQPDSSGGANDDGERGAAALAKVSYEREAPEGAVEKAHWKSLQQYHA